MKRTSQTLLLGACAFAGGWVGTMSSHNPPLLVAQQAPPPPPIMQPLTGNGLSSTSSTPYAVADRFEIVAQRIAPAVVAIEAVKSTFNASASSNKSRSVEESGSGVLTRIEGVPGVIVITNNHVVAHSKPEQITVQLADSRLVRPTKVWTDPESDIAILKMNDPQLPTAPLGDSDRMRVGHWVLAFGSPFGLNQTVTHGIISARERGQISLGATIRIKDFLQTDAAINPGSSGGPLVNLDGEVIGINTAIASQSGSNSGVAFSIPINLVKRVARQLVEKGSVSRGYLGVQLAAAMEPSDALRLGLDRARGALIEAVYPDTPAANAGLKSSDVVLQVDGLSIRNENHLINLISTFQAGQRIRLKVWRDRREHELVAVVDDWNEAQQKFRANVP